MGEDQMVFRGPGEGAFVTPSGSVLKANGATTANAYSLMEITVQPGRRVPTHVHGAEDEAWYLLEGEVTFSVAGERIVAAKGSYLLVRKGTAHGFANETTQPARMLELFSPAGMEGYFIERAAAAASAERSAAADYVGLDPETHAAIAEKYNMRFVDD